MTDYNGDWSGALAGFSWQNDSSNIVLGQRFRVTSAGLSATKVRFRIPSGSSNAPLSGYYVAIYHVGNTVADTISGPFSIAGYDQWIERSITPVTLTNGGDYIAAVLAPGGYYGANTTFFGTQGGSYDPGGPIFFYDSGVYRVSSTITYPSDNFGTPWYGVDVVVSDGGSQSIALGIASETETGRTLNHSKSRAIGLGVEAETGRILGHSKSRALGLAPETEAALALGKFKGKLIGLATETEAARVFSHTKSRAAGAANETEFAFPFAVKAAIIVAIARATEIDTARPFGARHPIILAIGRSSEVETALVLVAGSGYVDTDWVTELIGFESSVRSTLSNSYVYVEVLADLDVRGDVVEMALVPMGENPTSWKSATWTADSTATRAVARAQIDDLELEPGDYMAWVRITHPPIQPVLRSGKVRVF